MKILICNKFYYRRGGDCVYTINLANMLADRGHEVAVFAMDHPDTIDTPWRKYFPPEVNLNSISSKIMFFARSLGSGGTATHFKKLLEIFGPDVVHLNNIHSQLSPVIAQIAKAQGCKVVWTLHDYKLICPRYDCLRNGKTCCEECFSDKKNVLRHRCMKDSFAASIMAYCEAVKWNKKVLEACTDVFLCPSQFMMSKISQAGFSVRKMVYMCNFINPASCLRDDYDCRDDYYCYVGRLSKEKGVKTLIEVASKLPYRLVVVGDGPMKNDLPISSNIEFVGRKGWEDIKTIVGKARFLVVPSEWYENNPLSVIESLSLGTPVLGARIGGIPELIDNDNGLCFESGNTESLRMSIEEMLRMCFDYSSLARKSLKKFSDENYYEQLIKVYCQTT